MESYAIGVQNFEKLRKGNCVYIDKTDFIHSLLTTYSYYFLSRPRRFGKSLFLSTLEAYFEGKRELFRGLAIDKYEDVDWEPRPCFHIDLNGQDYTRGENALFEHLDNQLIRWEKKYGLVPRDPEDLSSRLANLIEEAYSQTGREVAILVDEYEKPILDCLQNEELKEAHINRLSGFYAVLKSADKYVKFCFITGVSQLGNLNIFSGLNNLRDISLTNEYAAICGITEDELKTNLPEGIAKLADNEGISYGEAVKVLKENYDGYHFAAISPDIYNPFGLLNALADGFISDYWFRTGSPRMLVKMFRNQKVDVLDVDGVEVRDRVLRGAKSSPDDLITLLYQTGYLTIKSYDCETRLYTLGFPNLEVEEGFLTALLPVYTGKSESVTEFDITKFIKELQAGDTEGFMKRLQSLFVDYPYDLALDVEQQFQSVIYMVMKLLGVDVKVEYHTSFGRIDMVAKTKNFIYVFEFKRDISADMALKQIDEKDYALPFAADGRKLIKVGVEFSTVKRSISDWKIAE